MMQAADQASIVQLFKEMAAAKRRDERWLDVQLIMADERERQGERDKKQREALDDALQQASAEQLAAFHDQLDRYDTATVQALMDNERRLDEARKRRDELLNQAYQLPDGRKVFKSDDGLHVFDQAGQEVKGIEAGAIPDGHPGWESFKGVEDEKRTLDQERGDLLHFQQKLDHARDRADRGASAQDLDALGADLKDAMPDSVKRLVGDPVAAPTPSAKSRQPAVVAGPAVAPS